MHVGKCGLCLEQRQLQRSHLLPSALYRMTRDPTLKNPNPVVMTRKITKTSSAQVTDHFLCVECEQRFSAEGEKYAMSQVHNGKRFPLLEALSPLAPSHIVPASALSPKFKVYFEADIPQIDHKRLLYYCMSVFWRASAHSWKGVTSMKLGPYEDSIRAYLLGKTVFPSNIAVQFFAATDALTQQIIFPPGTLNRLGPFKSYGFTSRGLVWWIHVGREIPTSLYSISYVNSPLKPISVCDCEPKTLDAFRKMSETSRVAHALQRRKA
jgi:hypothetical protein